MDGKIVKSVDYQFAKNKIFRIPINNRNPNMNRFVIVFCYISDLREDIAQI